MGIQSYDSSLQLCINLLTTYSEKIKASNKQGLGNNAKTSEEVYRGLLNLLYPNRNYQSFGKVNEAAVDLYNHSDKTVVQIKASLTRNEIQECVEKFSKTDWYKVRKYDLVILLTTSYCRPRVEKFKAGGYTYETFDHCYYDNNRLLKLIDGSNCHQVLEYLELMTTDSPTKVEREVTNAVNNYGPTLNITTTSGDVKIDGSTFDYSQDNRNLAIDETNPRTNFQNTLGNSSQQVISYQQDTPDNQLKRISKSIFKADDLYLLIEPDIKELYSHLEELENTRHSDIAKILWLVIYFENSEKKIPSLSLKQKMLEIKNSVNLSILPEYREIINGTLYFSDNSKSLISYGNSHE
jgi:hypothetical protein